MSWRAISINKEIYNRAVDAPEEIRQMGKVRINLFLPPTDIPESVVAEHDKNTDTFRIRFQYSLSEKGVYLFINEQASLKIGQQSGKPLEIEIKNIHKEKIDKIQLTNFLRKDLESLISGKLLEVGDLRRKTNLERTQEFINEKASDLAEANA